MKYSIIEIEEAQSSNILARELLKYKKVKEDTVIVVKKQTHGIGQQGAIWESEPYMNITCSAILFPKELEANNQFITSMSISLAIVDTVKHFVPNSNVSIKWPNDIYIGDCKVAGILIEPFVVSGKIPSMIVGIGLNVNQIVFKSDAPNPISLAQVLATSQDLKQVLDTLLENMRQYQEKEPFYIIEQYHLHLYNGKGYHTYQETETGRIWKGKIHSVSSEGLLFLETKEGQKKGFAPKEISFL